MNSPPAPDATPAQEPVLQHLEEVLRSDVFANAARQQRLLRHLVERHLQGRTSELKEYTLGVEVFDRGEQFDPRLDPIVRVEASRLRGRLQKFYEGSGSESRLRIDLPRGAYVPAFRTVEEPIPQGEEKPAPVEPAVMATPSVPENRGRRWSVVVGSCLICAGALLWIWPRPAVEPAPFASFTRVTHEETQCTSPTLSPDGQSIVYSRRDARTWNLYVRQLNGGDPKNLTPNSSFDNHQPSFSPDGKYIAFRSERDGGGVFILDLERGTVRRLSRSGFYPAWSPDATRIVVSTDTFGDAAENPSGRSSRLQVLDVKTGSSSAVALPGEIADALQPAWSPDSRRIAFWGTDLKGIRDLWTVELGGSGTAVPVTQDIWTDWSPAWAAGGSYLYFASDRGGAMNLWRIRIDPQSGKPQQAPEAVMTPASYSGWGVFSRDGKYFAYVRRLFSSKLYRFDFDSQTATGPAPMTPLTAGARRVREPDMSPDGSLLAVRIQDPQEDVATLRPDGSGLRRLTNDAFSDRFPRWSPDGSRIAFLSSRSGRFEIWSIQPDGGNLRQLTRDGAVDAVWTPDGALIGYRPTGEPFAIDPPGKDLKNWVLPRQLNPMAWSPDGKHVIGRIGPDRLVIFTCATGATWEVAVATPETSGTWLANSGAVLFSRGNNLLIADIAKHEVRTVLSDLKRDLHSRFAVARDGRSIFVAISEDEEDIWLGRRL